MNYFTDCSSEQNYVKIKQNIRILGKTVCFSYSPFSLQRQFPFIRHTFILILALFSLEVQNQVVSKIQDHCQTRF